MFSTLLSRRLYKALVSVATRSERCLSGSITVDYSKYETIAVTPVSDKVMHVELNRPKVRNAMNIKMFDEISHCFSSLDRDKRIRAIVFSGKDKMFTGGLDLMSFQEKLLNIESNDVARRAFELRDLITFLQGTTQAVAKCRKPVITAVHGGCIGVGIDIISATDIRYCSQDAWFQIKEVEIGIAPDLGTLQYFPLIVGNDSITRELTYSARKMDSSEALRIGFVGKVFPDVEATKQAAIEMANTIAAKSPIAIQGSKICLNQMRDALIADGLRFVQTWNMSALQSEDVAKAGMAVATKSDPPEFDDV